MKKDEISKNLKDSLMEMYDKGRSDTILIIIVLLECEKKINKTANVQDLIDTIESFREDHTNSKQN